MLRDVSAGSRYDSVEKRFDGSTVVSPATATKRERGRVVGCWSCTRAFRPGDASSPAGAGRTPKREMRRIAAEIDWDRLHAMLRAPLEFVSNNSASRRHADFEAVLGSPFRLCRIFRANVDVGDVLDAVVAVKTNIF